MDDDDRKRIRMFALQNASEHGGETKDKIVLSKIMGSVPELRGRAAEVLSEISPVVDGVNRMTAEQQRAELEREFPDAVRAEKAPGRAGGPQLPELDGAEQGRVVTRFPPEPNGYPHIGHAKAAIINSEYAKKYGGRQILRMDDTNPESERLEYYAAIKVGLEWLGIGYDTVKNTSDDIPLLYRKGLQLIESGSAYVCTCKREEISRNRREMRACKCRELDGGHTLERWHRMFEKFKPGQAIVRFRGDMGSENTAMRDPVLFRIVEARHPLAGDEYRVWPSYDFAVAVEDSVDGVTHAFRSKEYELRNDLYGAILDALEMRKPQMHVFSRLEFEGMPVSKRVLKQMIEEGKVSWYDDPRLPTLEALRKRGIRAEAIRRFVMSLGFTKSDTLAPFDSLEAFNRRIIDGESTRLHMVMGPVELAISGLPEGRRAVRMRNHPTADMGERVVEVGDSVYVASADCADLEPGSMIWLLGLGSVRVTATPKPAPPFATRGDGVGGMLHGKYEGDDLALAQGCQKIQWVPRRTAHRIRILIPGPLFVDGQYNEGSMQEAEAYTEPHYLELKDGDPIQFVRYGYCRKDSQSQAIYTHK